MTFTLGNHLRWPATAGTTDTTTGDRTFAHTAGVTSRAAVVVICGTGTAALVTGVDYGGQAMVLKQAAVDTSEPGRVEIWTLDNTTGTVPSGNVTVTFQGCTAAPKFAQITSIASTIGLVAVDTSGKVDTTTAANPNVNLNTSAITVVFGGCHSGVAAPTSMTAGAGFTATHDADYGQLSAKMQRSTAAMVAGTIAFGMTVASEDYCIAAVAFKEGPPTLVIANVTSAQTIEAAPLSTGQPIFINWWTTSWLNTITPKTVPVVQWQKDDVVLIKGGVADNGLGDILTPTVAGLTFTLIDSELPGGGKCGAYLWRAIAAAAGRGTISADFSGSPVLWGYQVEVWRHTTGLGNINSGTNTDHTLPLTRSADRSGVSAGQWDQSAFAGGVVPTPNVGYVLQGDGNTTGYAWHLEIWRDEGNAGSNDYGGNNASTGIWTKFAVEVLGIPPPVSGTNLVIQNVSSAQTVQAVTLTGVVTPLTIQNVSQAQTIQSVSLTPTLTINNVNSAQSTQNVVLSAAGPVVNLVINNVSSAQTIQPVTLGVHLVIQNVSSAQSIQTVSLVRILVIQNSGQSQTIQNVSLSPTLQINNVSQAQTIQPVTLGVHLVIQNVNSAQSAQNVVLSTAGVANLVVQNVTSAQTVQSVTLAPTLVINNVSSAQTIQNVSLVRVLVIQNVTSAQTVQPVTLIPTLTINNVSQAQTIQPVTLGVHLVIQNVSQAQATQAVVLTLPGAGDISLIEEQSGWSNGDSGSAGQGTNTNIIFTLGGSVQVGDKILLVNVDNWYTLANLLSPQGTAVATWAERTDNGLPLDGGTNDNHARVWIGTVTTAGGTVITRRTQNDDEGYAQMWVFRNADFDNCDGTETDASATSHVAPGLTPAAGKTNDFLCCVWGTQGQAINYTVPGSMTPLTEHDVFGINTYRAAHEQLTSASATGTRAATSSASTQWIAISVLMKSTGVAPTLAVNNVGSAQTIQSVTLAPTLQIQNVSQAQTIQAVSLAPTLQINNVSQAQTIQPVSLSPTLVINNVSQAQTIQPVTLGVHLVVQNVTSAHTIQAVSLAPTLTIQNVSQAQTIQSVTLAVTLQIQNSQQSQTTQAVTLGMPGVLAVQNVQQSQTIQTVTLGVSLVIQNVQQAQTIQSVTLALALTIQNVQQAQTIQAVSLGVGFTIQNSTQNQTISNVVLDIPTAAGQFEGWGIALR